MIEITLKLKGRSQEELLDLLKTSVDVVESRVSASGENAQEVELVSSGGEASLFIVNNGDVYHGVKINCCE